MTRTPTAYVDDAARALRQARTYLTDELARIDAALAALDHEQTTVTEITIEADADPAAKASAEAAASITKRRKTSSKTYPCPEPGCDFVATSPGQLGGHKNRHRPKPAPPAPVQADGHDGHTIDIGPVTVGKAITVYDCDHCDDEFPTRSDLARHRLAVHA